MSRGLQIHGIFSIIIKNDKREAAENPLPHFSVCTGHGTNLVGASPVMGIYRQV